MPEHDVIALDANFQKWIRNRAPGLTKIEPFLYYSVEHITKQYNLTDEQVRYGITDHPNDGGVDAIYCLVGKKNILLRDDVRTSITGADSIRIMVFTVKSSLSETGYSPTEIDKLDHFADDLLNLSGANLTGKYETRVITRMQTFKDRYLEFAHDFPRLILEFYYVTRGDGETLTIAGQSAIDRLKETVAKHRGLNSTDEFKFEPVDTVQLLEYVRRRRQFPRIIKWSQQPMPVGEGYVGMVRLTDYYKFLQDDRGELDELIFESNVRGSQGSTSVNRQMRKTLDTSSYPDFWQLNNGLTITCNRINPIDAFNLEVHDAQVVNGLQTSRQIFGHFSESSNGLFKDDDDRLVLVKLLPVTDDKIRDTIIRATNNQNPMRAAALRATDKLQRDIEDLFYDYGYFYDRRPGYWKDQEKEIVKIVSLNEIVQAMVALVLHRPDDARARPGEYVKEGKKGDEKYKQIFSRGRSRPLGLYVKSVMIIRDVEIFLDERDDLTPGDRTNLVFYVAYHLVCELTENASPSAEEIVGLDSVLYSDGSRLEKSLAAVSSVYRRLAKGAENPDTVAKGTELLAELRKELEAVHGLKEPVEAKLQKKKIKDVLLGSKLK